MDDNTTAESDFDLINRYTIQQLYNRFNDATWTIQDFREEWENVHPSVDNNALFRVVIKKE